MSPIREDPLSLLTLRYSRTSIIPLRPTGGLQRSVAYGVNDSGHAVGMGYNPGGIEGRALLWDEAGRPHVLPMPAGCVASTAWDINEAGAIVGTGRSSHGYVALVWPDPGSVATLRDLVPDGSSEAWALSDDGLVVGASTHDRATGFMHPCLWKDWKGLAIDLGTLGGETGFAHDINNTHLIVGWSPRAGGYPYHAFSSLKGTGMSGLRGLGGDDWGADACNDAGHIVGFARTSATDYEEHAVLWSDKGGPIDLGTLGMNYSRAFDINGEGVIVGESFSPLGSRAFIYRNGVMRDLNDLTRGSEWVLASAWGVSSREWIVG